jgi:uncharacterized protein YjbI with pentapeptide repeats
MANKAHFSMIYVEGVKVWNQWRRENPEIEPDLSGAVFRGDYLGTSYPEDLTEANLSKANLSGVDFWAAHLAGADFRGANLHRADLSGTLLEGADFRGANLHEASLRRINYHAYSSMRKVSLRGADLRGANLRGVDLTEAHLGDTIFGDTNITAASGLNTCHHTKSSILDNRTLAKSGSLPKAFLRGCGLSDWEIEATRLYQQDLSLDQATDIAYEIINTYLGTPSQYYSCFISYSHSDKDFAHRLYDQLQARGIRCWLDERHILPGDDVRDQIHQGINLWDKILLCCSEASLTSYWVNIEIDTALQKEQHLWKERGTKMLALIPLNLDGYLFQWESSRASVLKERHAEDLVGWQDDATKLDLALQRIEKALRADAGAREMPPEPKL